MPANARALIDKARLDEQLWHALLRASEQEDHASLTELAARHGLPCSVEALLGALEQAQGISDAEVVERATPEL